MLATARVRSKGYAILLTALIGVAEGSPAIAREVHHFDIARMEAAKAIQEFGAQSGVQILVAGEGSRGAQLNPVLGDYSVDDGLRVLLAGSGLKHRYVGTRAVALVAADQEGGGTTPSAPATPRSTPSETPPEGPSISGAATGRPYVVEEEVVVVGTHIRGIAPVGAEVIILGRQEIDKTGYATVQDVIRTLPQNFGGGVSEDQLGSNLSRDAATNFTEATALNLRGVGAGSTLVLLNGRRLAPGGQDGLFTDVSSLPLSAIERIEIMPDGASALYGSDAVGGVVNFVLRKDYEGAETQARFGTVTKGDLGQLQLSQTLGTSWGQGGGLLSVEYYQRDNLPATERPQMNSDLRPFGGDNFDTTQSNPGTIVFGPNTWAIPSGQDGTGLTPADLAPGTANLSNRWIGFDLLSDQERVSVVGTLSHQLTDHFSVFADAMFAKRELEGQVPNTLRLIVPPSNPFYVNPTGGAGPVPVDYDLSQDLGFRPVEAEAEASNFAVGGTYTPDNSWEVTGYVGRALQEEERSERVFSGTAELAAALADPDPATALNPFGDGSNTNPATLALIRDAAFLQRRSVESELLLAGVRADGPIFQIAGGDVRLAVGGEFRDQSLDSFLAASVTQEDIADLSREVTAAFAEMFVPLVGAGNRMPGIERLELSLAARFEDYSDYGNTTVPRFGLSWSPVPGFSVRGTWSESYKAPSLVDVDESANLSTIAPTLDPTTGGFTTALFWTGNNADLAEETAKIWTTGMHFAPVSVPRLALEMTYFDIDFTDRIEAPGSFLTILGDPSLANRVNRTPTAEQIAEACARSAFLPSLPGTDCLTTPVDVLLDARLLNTAIVQESGIDFMVSYGFDTGAGTFDLGLNLTYLLDFDQAATENEELLDLLDTPRNPLDLRARGTLSWRRLGFGATVFANYAGSYTDTISVPSRPIEHWTTFDLNLSYSFAYRSAGWLEGTQLFLTAQNVFDEDPPFVNNPAGIAYDPENADLLGRFVTFHIRKNW